jgi:hypothetical protein
MSTHCLSVDVCVRIIYSLSHKLSLSVSSLSQSCYDSSIVIEMFDISSQLCGVVCGVCVRYERKRTEAGVGSFEGAVRFCSPPQTRGPLIQRLPIPAFFKSFPRLSSTRQQCHLFSFLFFLLRLFTKI